MFKICTVFYGDSACPEHTSRGAWSHKGVIFKGKNIVFQVKIASTFEIKVS